MGVPLGVGRDHNLAFFLLRGGKGRGFSWVVGWRWGGGGGAVSSLPRRDSSGQGSREGGGP